MRARPVPSAAEPKRHCAIKGMAHRKVSLELQRDEVGGRIGGAEPRPAPPPVQHCSRTEE